MNGYDEEKVTPKSRYNYVNLESACATFFSKHVVCT